MGKNMRGSKLDDRIESFCQASSDLITNIHERCNNPENKTRRGRKKKKVQVEEEDWDKELV